VDAARAARQAAHDHRRAAARELAGFCWAITQIQEPPSQT
jgi:hypothetical protein